MVIVSQASEVSLDRPVDCNQVGHPMPLDEKFSSMRKGLLEFLILKIVAGGKVYVADIEQASPTSPIAIPAPNKTVVVESEIEPIVAEMAGRTVATPRPRV